MKIIVRTFLGAGITALYSSLAWSWDGFCEVMFCGVLLSGGLALLVILPGFYFLGFLATCWWPDELNGISVKINTDREKKGDVPAPGAWAEEVSVKSYLRKARAHGCSDEESLRVLQNAGWREEDVQRALQEMEEPAWSRY